MLVIAHYLHLLRESLFNMTVVDIPNLAVTIKSTALFLYLYHLANKLGNCDKIAF